MSCRTGQHACSAELCSLNAYISIFCLDHAGEDSKLPVKGLFYGIGHQPNSQLVAGQIDLDEHGYVKVATITSPLSLHVGGGSVVTTVHVQQAQSAHDRL